MYVFCSRPTPKSRPGNIIVPAIIIAAENYTRKYRDDDNLRRTYTRYTVLFFDFGTNTNRVKHADYSIKLL
jgi:hypothetical protein